jgi:hypothetical protein
MYDQWKELNLATSEYSHNNAIQHIVWLLSWNIKDKNNRDKNILVKKIEIKK